MHHLRTGKCVAKNRDSNHNCEDKKTEREIEKNCVYGFETEKIFEMLLKLGKRVIVYESFDPNDKDNDKVRGRGGYFSKEELKGILKVLSNKYKVELIRPERFFLNDETFSEIEGILRKVDVVCFSVEEQLQEEQSQ